MIIAIRKELEIGDTRNTANHWVVINVNHKVDDEKVRFELHGYKNRASRIEGGTPCVGKKFTIKNTYDSETGEIVTRHYNKFINFTLDDATSKHKELMKGAILQFMDSIPEFDGSIED